jgi:hypothetical protein
MLATGANVCPSPRSVGLTDGLCLRSRASGIAPDLRPACVTHE